jgi:hypothetical protein
VQILAEDSSKLFNKGAMNQDERARLDKFPASDCGAANTKLKPMESREISDIKTDLVENGFKEVRPPTPNTRWPPDMDIFVHDDGSLVKIKPNGDAKHFNKHGRPGPMVSKEVLTDLTESGEALTEFDNVAFKVTESGKPIPREIKHLRLPPEVMHDKVAKKTFKTAWADSGHTRPATPPGFTQWTSYD